MSVASPQGSSAGQPQQVPGVGQVPNSQVVPINAFVAAANRQSAPAPASSGIASPSSGTSGQAPSTGIASPQLKVDDLPTSPVSKVLFEDTGDGVHTTRYHKFPLPGPLREYAPEYEKGRYLVPSITGESMFDTYDRATNVAKSVEEHTGLNNWKIRQVLKGVKASPELMNDLDTDNNSWWGKKQINRAAEAAEVVAGSRWAGEFGDCIHAWTAAVENGQVTFDDVPEEVKPHVEVYFRTLAEYGVRTAPGMIERVIYHSKVGACGSFDRIYILSDGTAVIGDLKTSASIDLAWLAIAIQLALYASASALLSEDGKLWQPMPALSQVVAVVAHIPSDANPPTCTLKKVDLTAGLYALDQALILRSMRDNAIKVIPSNLKKP